MHIKMRTYCDIGGVRFDVKSSVGIPKTEAKLMIKSAAFPSKEIGSKEGIKGKFLTEYFAVSKRAVKKGKTVFRITV
jgi:hypothetical protein